MKPLTILTSFLLLSFLNGCALTTPTILEKQSSFDGSYQQSIGPRGLYVGSPIGFELYHRSTMEQDKVVLVAYIEGAELFSRGKSLHFNIDGEFVHLSAIDKLTNIEIYVGLGDGYRVQYSNYSSKRYEVDLAFLRSVVDAKNVSVKINLDRAFTEGVFSNSPVSAKAIFKKFYNQLIDH